MSRRVSNVVALSAALGAVVGFLLGFPIDQSIAGLVLGAVAFGGLAYAIFLDRSHRIAWWLGATMVLCAVVVTSYANQADVLRERLRQDASDDVGAQGIGGTADATELTTTVAPTTTQPTTTTIPIPQAGVALSASEGLPADVIRWSMFKNEDGLGVATVAIFDATKIDPLPESGQFRIVAGRFFEENGSPMAGLESLRSLAYDELLERDSGGDLPSFDWANPSSYNSRLCSPSIPLESLDIGERQVVYALVFDSTSNELVHDEFLVLDRQLIVSQSLDTFDRLNELVNSTNCAPEEEFVFVD